MKPKESLKKIKSQTKRRVNQEMDILLPFKRKYSIKKQVQRMMSDSKANKHGSSLNPARRTPINHKNKSKSLFPDKLDKKTKKGKKLVENIPIHEGNLRISKHTNLLTYVSSEEKKILLAIDKRLDQLDELDKKITLIEEKLKKDTPKSLKHPKSHERKYLEDRKITNRNNSKDSSTLMDYLDMRRMSRDISSKMIKREMSYESLESRNRVTLPNKSLRSTSREVIQRSCKKCL